MNENWSLKHQRARHEQSATRWVVAGSLAEAAKTEALRLKHVIRHASGDSGCAGAAQTGAKAVDPPQTLEHLSCSVIIPAYNEEAYLPRTLEALKAGSRVPREVIVVDNASSDRTPQIAARYGAVVIREPLHNIGRVRNVGAAAATGDILVFLDADTIVPPELFDAIAAAMSKKNTIGGAVAVDYTPFRRWWMRWYIAGWRFWSRFFNMKQGAAQFCGRDVFGDVGGYDDHIYVGEDIHFYWRLARYAKRVGGRVQFVDSPRVVTSSRRFDKMSLWKILVLTHPVVIWLTWRRRAVWTDWYDTPVR